MSEQNDYVFDDRAESFLQVGEVAAHVARIHAKVNMDTETHERWRQLMALLREVDTLADDDKVPADKIMADLQDFLVFDKRYPALSPERLGIDKHSALLGRTKKLLRLSELVSREESAKRFTALRVAEGRETANLLADSASEAVRSQPGFSEKFMPAIRSLGITATLIDSILDARVDKNTGKITIDTDAEYYRLLATEAFRRSGLGAAALLHGSVMGEFGVMSVNRLKNRIRHGVTAYSSLALFRHK